MKKTLLTTAISSLILWNAIAQDGSNTEQDGSATAPFVMDDRARPGIDYLENTVIFRLKDAYRNSFTQHALSGAHKSAPKGGNAENENDVAPLLDILGELGAGPVRQKFPHTIQSHANKRLTDRMVDISLIYSFRYNGPVPLEDAINRLRADERVAYAEPHWIPHLQYVPNDTFANDSMQWYLGQIKAYEAWDVTKGDTNMVIGYVDTGTDFNHRDLDGWDKIKRNWAEDTNNGVDDDGDGYIDNYRGWDLGMNDNRPQTQGHWHGAHVTGSGVARSDNGWGIASPGFNCTYLPVKVDTFGVLVMAYEGIVYAADHGAKVINCSWGRNSGGFSQSQQDVINYATYNHDALVISSAGNAGNSLPDFPASYENVLSVAGTDKNDTKYSASSYGTWVDLSAPAKDIRSTIARDTFLVVSGTSMACGIVSGCAALVRTRFPQFNALQTGEQLKATADNIDAVNTSFLQDKLGAGRINLYRAVTETPPMISMTGLISTDGNDGVFTAGDTVDITGLVSNFLSPTAALTVSFSSQSPFFTFLDSTFTVGFLNSLDTTDNFADPIRLIVLPDNPTITANITITFRDGTYEHSQAYNIDLTGTSSVDDPGHSAAALFPPVPNPAREQTSIAFRLSTGGETMVSLIDLTGRIWQTRDLGKLPEGKHKATLDISGLAAGIYIVRLMSGRHTAHRRLMVQ